MILCENPPGLCLTSHRPPMVWWKAWYMKGWRQGRLRALPHPSRSLWMSDRTSPERAASRLFFQVSARL